MGLFDEIFDKSNMKAVVSQMNAGKPKNIYTIEINEPTSITIDDEAFYYKVKFLLMKNKVNFNVIEQSLN